MMISEGCCEWGCSCHVSHVHDHNVMGEHGGSYCYVHRERADMRCVRVVDGAKAFDGRGNEMPSPRPLPRQLGAEEEYPRYQAYSDALRPLLPAGWGLWQDVPEDTGLPNRGLDFGVRFAQGDVARVYGVRVEIDGSPAIVVAYVGEERQPFPIEGKDVAGAVVRAVTWCNQCLVEAWGQEYVDRVARDAEKP